MLRNNAFPFSIFHATKAMQRWKRGCRRACQCPMTSIGQSEGRVLVDRRRPAVYGAIMDYAKLITLEPDKRSGQPCIRGLRMTVQDVLEYLASGMSAEEILADFPDLAAEDIRACLAFAADRERRRRVVSPASNCLLTRTCLLAWSPRSRPSSPV